MKKRIANLIVVLLCLLLAVLLRRAWRYGKSQAGIDCYQYWVVGQEIGNYPAGGLYSEEARARLGREYLEKSRRDGSSPHFRAAAERRKKLEIYSTPFLYSIFSCFSSGNYNLDHQRFLLLCLLCGGGGIVGFCLKLRYSLAGSLTVLVLVLAWFDPFWSDITVANVNQLQLCLLALFLWVEGRRGSGSATFLGGAIIGLVVAFKPNLIFVAGLLFVVRLKEPRHKKLILYSLGLLTALAAAFAFTGLWSGSVRCWVDWAKVAASLPDKIISTGMGNFSPAMLIRGWTGINTVACLTLLFGGAAVFRLLRRGGKKRSPAEGETLDGPLFAVGAGCLIYLLSARLVWFHYYLFVIPTVLIILQPRKRICSSKIILRRALAAGAVLLVAVAPTAVLLGIKGASQQAILVNAGTLILFILLLTEPLSPPPQPLSS